MSLGPSTPTNWVPADGFRLALLRPSKRKSSGYPSAILDFETAMAPRTAKHGGSWVITQGRGMWADLGHRFATAALQDRDPALASKFYRKVPLPPALFMRFGTMDPTPRAILGFANRYGLLGLRESLVNESSEREEVWDVEHLETWRREILRMSWAIQLKEAMRLHDSDAVGKMLHLDKGRIRLRGSFAYTRSLGREELRSHREVFESQLQFAHSSTFESMGEAASACLVFLVESGMRDHVTLRMIPDPETLQLHLTPVATSLAGDLWVQLAKAITANKEIRSCPNCGEPVPIVPPATRRNRKYCTEACRSAAYRKRRDSVSPGS